MKQKPSPEARPGSLKYAAQRIGVSLPSLYQLIRAGKIRTYRVGETGRAHRIADTAIADCIALLERENGSASQAKGAAK
jgi:excisionase family DNA binding protein